MNRQRTAVFLLTNIKKINHPQVVSNLYTFIHSAEHKRRCFEECRKSDSWTPLTSTVFFSYGSQWGPTVRLHSSKYLSLYSAKKFIEI